MDFPLLPDPWYWVFKLVEDDFYDELAYIDELMGQGENAVDYDEGLLNADNQGRMDEGFVTHTYQGRPLYLKEIT